jgi:hypothetical protein
MDVSDATFLPNAHSPITRSTASFSKKQKTCLGQGEDDNNKSMNFYHRVPWQARKTGMQ